MSTKTESSETTLLRRRVAALKREAASLGLLAPGADRPLMTPIGRGTGPLSRGVLANRAVDRRPRQLLVTGFSADDKEDVLTHLLVSSSQCFYRTRICSVVMASSLIITHLTCEPSSNYVIQATLKMSLIMMMTFRLCEPRQQ